MNKGKVSNLLRNLRILFITDWIRFYLQKFKNRGKNQGFRNAHPEIALPPDYLMYESFQMDYDSYYSGGLETAEYLVEQFRRFGPLEGKVILDWGCGPGRIIRHLPRLAGASCQYYGTDYNAESIAWCAANLAGITFNKNSLEAKLSYPDNFFDIIFGISIFTHLSEEMHYAWAAELTRILKPGGLMLFTLQGENFLVKLIGPERQRFERGELVVRGMVKEGHRTYSAFQPKAFVEKLFTGVTVADHIVVEPTSDRWVPQDVWVFRK